MIDRVIEMHWLIESLFYDVLIHVIGYPIARLLLPLLSLNKIGVQPLHSFRNRI